MMSSSVSIKWKFSYQSITSAGIVFPSFESEVFSKPSVLEPALKVVTVCTVSDLAASEMIRVRMILAFDGLVWYNAGATGVSAQIPEPVPEFQVAGIKLAFNREWGFGLSFLIPIFQIN